MIWTSKRVSENHGFSSLFSCFSQHMTDFAIFAKTVLCKVCTWKVKSVQKSAIRHQLFYTFLHPFLHPFRVVHLAPLGDPVFTPFLTPFWGCPKWAISRFPSKPHLSPYVCYRITRFCGFGVNQKDVDLCRLFSCFGGTKQWNSNTVFSYDTPYA